VKKVSIEREKRNHRGLPVVANAITTFDSTLQSLEVLRAFELNEPTRSAPVPSPRYRVARYNHLRKLESALPITPQTLYEHLQTRKGKEEVLLTDCEVLDPNAKKCIPYSDTEERY